ncbi:MAG: hypothetical protein WBP13_05955 [Methylophilaceae bacterium]
MMNDRLNKNSICSIVAIEIVDFSKLSDSEQLTAKYSLNQLVNSSLKEYAKYDRILLDHGDGIVIAYMALPEDLLSIALDIRNGILAHNAQGLFPMRVLIGMHLGVVRVVHDVNDQPNVFGEGLKEARRLMQLGKENTIIVSPAYYAITLPLSGEIAEKYAYTGFKLDSNTNEYTAYALNLTSDTDGLTTNEALEDVPDKQAQLESLPSPLQSYQPDDNPPLLNGKSGKYIAFGVLTMAIAAGLFYMKNSPKTPEIIMSSPAVAVVKSTVLPAQKVNQPNDAVNDYTQSLGLLPNESIEDVASLTTHQALVIAIDQSKAVATTPEVVKTETPKVATSEVLKTLETMRILKKSNQKSKVLNDDNQNSVNAPHSQTKENVANAINSNVEIRTEDTAANKKEKPDLDTIKIHVEQVTERQCSQAEVALAQCH